MTHPRVHRLRDMEQAVGESVVHGWTGMPNTCCQLAITESVVRMTANPYLVTCVACIDNLEWRGVIGPHPGVDFSQRF